MGWTRRASASSTSRMYAHASRGRAGVKDRSSSGHHGCGEAGGRLWDLEDEIAAIPAATLAGIAAKASVIRAGYRGIMADVNEGILDSLLRDIAALGKEAAHG